MLREKLNDNRMISGIGAALIVLISGYFLVGALKSTSNPTNAPQRAFFTVDDGTTYFTDDIKKIPPFDFQGKTAVRAYVASINGANKVVYLERFKPESKQALEMSNSDPKYGREHADQLREAYTMGREQKKPGAKEWFNAADSRKLDEIIKTTCTPGSELVDP